MKLLYFAWLRERLGMNEEEIKLPAEVQTVAQLFDWQKSRGEPFSDIFEHSDIIQVAIDKQHVQDRNASLTEAAEIALFPPMTGG